MPMCTGRRASTAPTTSSPTARMDRQVEVEQRPTSSVGRAAPSAGEAGFTLIEVVCVLAIIAILAAIALPALPLGTSRARIESYAVETAAMLKADRNAAIRRRVQIVTHVNAPSRSIRSGATGRVIHVPND